MADELLVTSVRSQGSSVPGRSLNAARSNHFVIDEPAYNGGPGEALTPAEAFLSGVSACGVLLIEAFARKEGIPLRSVMVQIEGLRTKADPANFKQVNLVVEITGADDRQADHLVEKYKAR